MCQDCMLLLDLQDTLLQNFSHASGVEVSKDLDLHFSRKVVMLFGFLTIVACPAPYHS